MKIGIVVNDSLPGMGLPCSGQGLRAWGLIEGLLANGVEARALIRQPTLVSRLQRWKDINTIRFPDWVRITTPESFAADIADLDALVMHNWAAAEGLRERPAVDTRLVYDFFSATLVEHAFISSDPEYLETVRRRKKHALKLCDLFIANGPGRRTYAEAYLEGMEIDAEVCDIPMCLPWLGGGEPADAVLVGGYQQRWTRELDRDGLVELARALPEMAIVSVGAGYHYHFGADRTARAVTPDRPGNMVAYDVLPFEDYLRVNQGARVFVDLSALNDERLISFSSRGILSIAAGCPVLHNQETDLGALVSEFDAGCTISGDEDPSDPGVLSAKLETCLSLDRRDGCRALWEAHFDARKGARKLVQLVEDA